MPRFQPGPANQKRAWSLIEALVLAKVGSEAQAVVAGVELEYLNWKPGSKVAPQIRVKAQLTELSKLTKSKLDGEQIREIISLYLGEKFLGILEDKRRIKHGKGAENWHFILTLWYTDLEKNRQKFNKEWERRKFGDTEESVSLDLVELAEKEQEQGTDIDKLVREVRSRAYEKIKTLHGTMRMLRVNRRVPVDDIYIDLNVLEQVSCDRTFSDWRRDFQPDWRSFDRLGLEQAIGEGVPALDIVRDYPKLMVFGKPGSGKTTFLKSLATRCIDVERQLQWNQRDYVPIFITLKSFAKDARKRDKFSLFDSIYQREFCSWGEKNQRVVEFLLEQGRALVLLDGLDEVQGQEYEPVIEEVESFCEYFHRNRFVITCRTQSQRYKFESFTDVEVADFKPEQVNRFIKRWFTVVVDNAESENLAANLIEQLQQSENKPIADLAVTPVLLNLICFVFWSEKGNLPKNRADLYKKGLRDLLEGLDESKGVQREPVYEELTPESIEKLLAYLAATLFEANDYFPEQETLEKLIGERLQISIPKATKILKSIEEQSGLIVERSEGFWSFSHLTFQEYFTAKWFCDRTDWQGLISHIKERHWREIFMLAVGMAKNADELLCLTKKNIDAILAEEQTLQAFMQWANQKSIQLEVSYKPAAIRAFYFTLELLPTQLSRYIERNLAPAIDHKVDFAFHVALTPDLALDRDLIYLLELALEENSAGIARIRMNILESTYPFAQEKTLAQSLQQLREELSSARQADLDKCWQWWQAYGQDWTTRLRKVMVEHRKIGQDWQFTNQHLGLLQQYYDVNKLLVDCLNSDCALSDEVKEGIEETLLLPIAEIEKRQQQM